ncbi:MAG TPA: 23S rRNA (guanosine(2251)-2'-O)-methyltransferase RlmB, partial [Pseudonocardiaceae bacterium]|nr:23S rRNA (guanosine(2251)-2'-O)-methyltransferase RlmB [Pseudonocardiaceae bacterium]
MTGNSRRKGALRKPGTKKGAVVGSGGQKAKGLRGRGATPPAELRPGHPAQREAAQRERRAAHGPPGRVGSAAPNRRHPETEAGETVLGRNPVLECLR